MSGKSGKVAGRDNFGAFERFIAARNRDGEWQEYVLPGGRELNKTAISRSKECGFARSVFVQNPAIKSRCSKLVDELVAKGILLDESDNLPPLGCTGLTRDEAVAELIGAIAALESEIADLTRILKETDDKVAYYETEARLIINSHRWAKEGH